MSEDRDADVLRRDARRIFLAAVQAADPAPLVHGALLNAPELRERAPVHVLAAGKAAHAMAAVALETLGDRVESCVIAAPAAGGDTALEYDARVQTFGAGHPLPDEISVLAGGAARDLVQRASPDSVVVVLLSGGASSVMTLPAAAITLADYRDAVASLQAAGADIHEVNCIRKHIDDVKGGNLARIARTPRIVVLLISDVVGNDLDVIGSGPFAPDRSTFRDALDILHRRSLMHAMPPDVAYHLRAGADGEVPETPATGDTAFDGIRHQILADNTTALDAAVAFAGRLGYPVVRVTEPVTGEARDAGRRFAELLLTQSAEAQDTCIIAGGETIVTITGDGAGGRSQELALAAAIVLDGCQNVVLLAAGTDGVDGSTDAAGGIVDGHSAARMRASGVDPDDSLRRNDSHAALAASGDLVLTGPTGTNVMDIQVLLRAHAPPFNALYESAANRAKPTTLPAGSRTKTSVDL
ncbi:MAG: DUF4147 domain-containing protein [Longimicrobiales bacterium]